MHGSHKLWITIAVFLVVIGLLLGMYFTATPDKVGAVMKNKQSGKMNSPADNKNEPVEVTYEDMNLQEVYRDENAPAEEPEFEEQWTENAESKE
ncbi:MAG: hypothetical protein FWH43_00235 [Endomicrobia bacterium]|nr:hypothetical protein [Endomicrobiia bacterium]